MQEVYTKEETQSFKVGAYVALAILAIIGYKAFTAQEIEHADNGATMLWTPVSDGRTVFWSETRFGWRALPSAKWSVPNLMNTSMRL